MSERYDPQLKARLTLDDDQRVRGINHQDEFWQAEESAPRKAALAYLRSVSDRLGVPTAQLDFAHQPVTYLEPRAQDTEFRLSEEKTYFDSTTEGFYQTHLNVPVWGAGVAVTLKHNPTRVVSAVNTSLADVHAELPSGDAIERWRTVIEQVEPVGKRASEGLAEEGVVTATGAFVGELVGGFAFKRSRSAAAAAAREQARQARVLSGRFFVYRYDPDERLPGHKHPESPPQDIGLTDEEASPLLGDREPTLPLPEVDRRIKPGRDYLVAELVFFYPTSEWGDINWRALVELQTGSILYLRALAAHVDGLVFVHDPIGESGNAANGPASTSAVLNAFRDDETLPNLNAPVGGVQSLAGSHVAISEEESPVVAAPTRPAGSDFDYDARTNNFAAVNAYYHANRFFDFVEDLGFPLSTYFGGTTFPVPVDRPRLGDGHQRALRRDGLRNRPPLLCPRRHDGHGQPNRHRDRLAGPPARTRRPRHPP